MRMVIDVESCKLYSESQDLYCGKTVLSLIKDNFDKWRILCTNECYII